MNQRIGLIQTVIIMIFIGVFLYIFLPQPKDTKLYTTKDPYTDHLVNTGYVIREFDLYVEELKKKGGISKHKISVLVGSYYYTDLVLAAVYTDKYDRFSHIIFIEKEFY